MATWDSADLLARCKLLRLRPAVDEKTTDAQWYMMLTEAEAAWKPVIASHVPEEMYSAPVLMTSADSGATYTLPGSEVDPIGLVVYRDSTCRVPLWPGPMWDLSKDYTHDSAGTIRMIGRARTFPDGPYARFVAAPAAISSGVDSTIFPKRCRILLVHRACQIDASRGGMDDPAFYRALEQAAAFGDPAIPGDIGLIGSLKKRNAFAGTAAFSGRGDNYAWWRPV